MPAPGQLDALLEALRLKSLLRAGWVRKQVPSPESVASHSWGVAWLVLATLPEGLDRGKALAYAVLHDLPEVRVGDITPVDGVSKQEKEQRESAAIQDICGDLQRGDLAQLWLAYEAQADEESRFVRQLDRLDMALQALAQHEAGIAGMQEFVASADRVVAHPALRPWMDEIKQRMR